MIPLSEGSIEVISGNKIERFAGINEVGAQISPSKRLHSLLEQIIRSEVRKVAISLIFPLLEKFNMPIKLV